MQRSAKRIAVVALAVLGAAAAFSLLSPAPAAAAGPCTPDDLVEVSFSVNGGPDVADLAAVGPLVAGDVVTMTWTDVAPDCDLTLSLSAHRVDTSPTAEVVGGAATCVGAACDTSLTVEVPARTSVCTGALVAATGPSQLDRGFYGTTEIGVATIDDGDCAPAAPSAFLAMVCDQGGVGAFLTNTGEQDAAISIRRDGVEVERLELGPRTADGPRERFEMVPVVEDTSASITVVDGTGVTLAERTFVRNCFAPPPAPSIEASCAAGGAEIVFDNRTPEPITYSVRIDDGAPTDTTIPAFSLSRLEVVLPEDEPTDLAVSRPGVGEEARATVTPNCEDLSATAVPDCANGGLAVTLRNDGEAGAVAEVMIGDASFVTVPVPANDEVVARFPLADGSHDVSVVHRGDEVFAAAITLSCTPPPTPQPPAPAPPPAPVAPASPAPLTPTPAAAPATPQPATAAGAATDAPAEVLGVSLSRPRTFLGFTFDPNRFVAAVAREALARTGADPRRPVGTAGALLLAGGLCLHLSARRKHAYQ